ncbi:MAG TPA: sugar transferase [Gemmatimonadaceae bacterium]|nr:sugar transferase [Gemmatimonadaceae bacterium]
MRPIEIAREADAAQPTTLDGPLVPRPRAELANRVVNVGIAVIALIVLSPIILLVALAVKLTSRGPILYTQTRVGLDRRGGPIVALYDRRERNHGGRIFTIYKFRSMYVDAERHTGAVWATQKDPRITLVGRFLRAYRLDELPQLLNVIKGDMNIVGPRPERPSIFARLRENISEYPLRQRARPGITGWAQVNQSYDSCVEDVRAKVHYDLEYIARQSLVEDFRIMLRTVPVMLFRRGGW